MERAEIRTRIRVLVIDDHPAVGEAVRSAISDKDDLELVAHANTAEQGFVAARMQKPDVALVDLSLGGSHGLDLIRRLNVEVPDVHILVFSLYDDRIYAERALRTGAMGYIMKTEPMNQVVEAIRIVAKGDVYVSKLIASRILSKMVTAGAASAIFAVDDLTEREMDVFQLIGDGSSANEISEKLNLGKKTVEIYRRRIKEKLDLESVEELMQFAIEWKHSQSVGTASPGTKRE